MMVIFATSVSFLKILMLTYCPALIFHMRVVLISFLLLLRRFSNGGAVRSLCTTSVRLSEKKSGVASSNQDENGENEPSETPPLIDQKVEVDKNNIIIAKEGNENQNSVKSETGDGIIPQVQLTVNTEHQKQPEAQTAKSGKESLLNLLSAMKVEVTNKRKVKGVKFRQNYESSSTSKPAAMESTISMFQQATVEASTQR